MSKCVGVIRVFIHEEGGATAVEYGLMLALVAAVIVGGAKVLGIASNGSFTDFDAKMKVAAS